MNKQAFVLVLLLLWVLWGASCVRKKNPVSLGDGNGNNGQTIPSTCPQTDIPWPSLADSPWPMSTVNPQGIARSHYLGPQEGKVLWAIALLDTINKATQGGPAIGLDGTIYIGESGGDFFAISPEGQIKWRLPARIYTGPVVAADSTIYIGGGDFYALRPDGTVKWKFDGYFVEIRPLLGIDGTIYTKNYQGIIYALTPDGNLKWQNEIGQIGTGYMSASPDGSTIYAPGRDSTLIALDAENGAILWSVKTRLYYCAGPTVDSQGNLYFYSADNQNDLYVYSVNPSRKLRWKFKVGYCDGGCFFSAAPYAGITIDYNGYCYFDWRGWYGTGVISLDYTGHLRWKLECPNGVSDSPVICDSENNLYILSVSGPRVWCYLPEGTQKFSIEIPSCTSSQLFPGAVSKDGIMYFGGNSEWLVALK